MNNKLLALIVLLGSLFLSSGPLFAAPAADTGKSVTILLINDVYRLDYLGGVRTLRQQLEQKYGKVLLLHAGDFLFPSLLSRRFQGAQMIDLMNRLDGDAAAFDPWMLVTFGNHEFEKNRLKYHRMLTDRITESQFDWVSSNIQFKEDDKGQPLVKASNLHDYRIIEVDGTRVGIFGITIDIKHPSYVENFGDYVETSRNLTARLRQEGADLVIALTHLTLDQDKKILGSLRNDGPDIILGGHEHNRQVAEIGGRILIKADADAYSAAVVRISPREGAVPAVEHSFQTIPGEIAFDQELVTRAHEWEERYQDEYCRERELDERCLEETVGKTQVELVAEELTIRRFETNIGNWIMDNTLERFRDQGAKVGFVNSGSLRLNHNIPAGSEITRKTLNELFAYPNHMVLIRITGTQLQQIAERAIRDWTGNGHWLQISGFRFRHHPGKGIVDRLHIITAEGERPIAPDEEILAVTNYYLIDEKGDRDGFLMLNRELMVNPEAERPKLRDIVVEELAASGKNGIAPSLDGRICNAMFMEETCLRVVGGN